MRTSKLTAQLACLLLALLVPTLARAAVITNDTTIGVTDATYDGQDLVVSNAVLTVDGPHAFNSLRVAAGATLAHTAVSNGILAVNISVTNESHVLIGTNLTELNNTNVLNELVRPLVVTDVNGLLITGGYLRSDSNGRTFIRRTEPPGIPDGSTVLVSYSYNLFNTNTGLALTITNELAIEPGAAINVGGRGYTGTFGSGPGGSSGGTISGGGGGHGGYGGLSSSNAAGGNVYGSLLQPADKGSGGGNGAVPGFSARPGGAGGGTVILQIGGAAIINGSVSADGVTSTNSRSGGGAGGSVLINAMTISGSGLISAGGGAGEPIHGGGGGGGRIALYCQTNLFVGSATAQGGNGWKVGGAGTVYVAVANNPGLLILDNGGRSGTNSLVAMPTGADLEIRGAARAIPSGEWAARNVAVASDGVIEVLAAGSTLTLGASNLTIAAGGRIAADRAGYQAYSGSPGAGSGNSNGGGGGGNGGMGGSGATNTVAGGSEQGAYNFPTSFGGPGGVYSVGGSLIRGGGAIRIIVSNEFRLGGKVSADGADSTFGGACAGGSIWITASSLTGNGSVTANGGDAMQYFRDGGGGGGRIAIFAGTNSFVGVLEAFGGSGSVHGGAGTIFIKNTGERGQLILDNQGDLGATTYVASQQGGPVDLLIRNGAIGSVYDSTYTNIYLGPNGWLTNIPFAGTPIIYVTVPGNMVIGAGSGLLMDGAGNAQNQGSGRGFYNSSTLMGGGGGHGGYGASASNPNSASGGVTAGATQSPSAAGSGGGGGSGSPGGSAGGAIMLTVNGSLQNDGVISANGSNGGGTGGGGGSGGGIGLTIGSFSGSGSIRANGGNGAGIVGGGGGGGRIAVRFNTNSFTGSITAFGGSGASFGGAGTIYQKNNAESFGRVTLDNGNNRGTNTVFDSSSDLLVLGQAIGVLSGTWSGQNVRVESNGVLRTVSESLATISVSGDVFVADGGVISADGLAKFGSSIGYSSAGLPGGGGSYGGTGGGNPLTPALAYGSVQSPNAPGSGGGNGSLIGGSYPGGYGGGALKIIAGGNVTVNGRLSVDGADGAVNSGGGSGGGLWISTTLFSGKGLVSAKGGAGNPAGGGGGGGRIGVSFASNNFTGILTAGGGAGSVGGGAGTVFLKPNSSGGLLLLDNNGLAGTNTPLSSSYLLPAIPFDLVIRGGASALPLTPLPLLSNLTIGAGASLWMATNSTTNLFVSVIRDLTLASGSAIVATGRGYLAGQGTGHGNTSLFSGSGGGYGGNGGASAGGAVGGVSYGSANKPVHLGSGGGQGTGGNNAGSGGGAIRLSVGGTLLLDNATVATDGSLGIQDGSGGGAGGSIWINAGAIIGSGLIGANGGDGELFNGGGGGGGRIAIYSAMNTFTGAVSVVGGSAQ